MALNRLQIINFRNHTDLLLPFSPGISLFTGLNGVGKTTILEAISLMGTGRSFRPAKNEDFIHSGKQNAQLVGSISHLGLKSELKVNIYPQGKKYFLDDKYVRKMSSIHHLLPSVVFSPGDHAIIEGDSSERKSFLNRAAANYEWAYAELLSDFQKVLLQRNQLLKKLCEMNTSLTQAQDQLAVWDQQFIDLSTKLLLSRSEYLNKLQKKVEKEYQRIAEKEDCFNLRYLPLGIEDFSTECSQNEVEKNIAQHLTAALRKDLAIGTSSVGPHKDEILLTLNGNKAKFYGSQGEKRTCALALRLGEVALFKEKHLRSPVLLIDDVSSELDKERRKSLVELLHHEEEQVMITSTEVPTSLLKELDRNFEHFDLQVLRGEKHGYDGKNHELYSG